MRTWKKLLLTFALVAVALIARLFLNHNFAVKSELKGKIWYKHENRNRSKIAGQDRSKSL